MAPDPESTKRIEEAQKISKTEPAKAEAIYKDILSKGPGSGEAALRQYETALMSLGELYRDGKKSEELAELVRTSRSTLSSFAKAKTAKLGRCLLLAVDPQSLLYSQFANSSISSPQYPTLLTFKYP